jgi:hypothetical protein
MPNLGNLMTAHDALAFGRLGYLVGFTHRTGCCRGVQGDVGYR